MFVARLSLKSGWEFASFGGNRTARPELLERESGISVGAHFGQQIRCKTKPLVVGAIDTITDAVF